VFPLIDANALYSVTPIVPEGCGGGDSGQWVVGSGNLTQRSRRVLGCAGKLRGGGRGVPTEDQRNEELAGISRKDREGFWVVRESCGAAEEAFRRRTSGTRKVRESHAKIAKGFGLCGKAAGRRKRRSDGGPAERGTCGNLTQRSRRVLGCAGKLRGGGRGVPLEDQRNEEMQERRCVRKRTLLRVANTNGAFNPGEPCGCISERALPGMGAGQIRCRRWCGSCPVLRR
jgi:hypothetical protein